MSLETEFMGVKLKNPFLPASGIQYYTTTYEGAYELYESGIGGFQSKTLTFHKREGNSEPRFIELKDELGKIIGYHQAMGLPNPGYENFKYKEIGKLLPIFASIYSDDLKHIANMTRYVSRKKEVKVVVLNSSCPNLGHSPMIDNLSKFEAILATVKDYSKKPVSVKIPPIPQTSYLEDVMKIISKEHAGVNSLNSYPRTCPIDIETRTFKNKSMFGGLSGESLTEIALGQTWWISNHFPEIDIIHVGGVYNWGTAVKAILLGAKAVAIGSVLEHRKPSEVVPEFITNLEMYMHKHGFETIEDMRKKVS